MFVRITAAILCTLCTVQEISSFGIVPQKLSSSSSSSSSFSSFIGKTRRISQTTSLFNAASASSDFGDDTNNNNNNNNNNNVENKKDLRAMETDQQDNTNDLDRATKNHPQRLSEFTDLEPLVMSDMRRQRIMLDEQNKRQFVEYGNDLWDLRSTMDILSTKLIENISSKEENGDGSSTYSPKTEKFIRRELRKAESRDPELVYKLQLQAMEEATRDGRLEDAQDHSELAKAARSCLPQFNLEGLWVGKYGIHGYEMINVTYVGDTLIAFKVTGDKNVPMGEITFQADLSPTRNDGGLRQIGGSGSSLEENTKNTLEPIKLSDTAAKKWGTTHLPRYSGLGQVSEEGHKNSQWLDGQLIVIGKEYFSFAWVPIEHQIFFGRPSPELAIKMLKDKSTIVQNTPSFVFGGEKSWGDSPPTVNDDVHVLKDYAHYLLQTTRDVIDEEYNGLEDHGCIYHDDDMEECAFQ
mmetsp:Transcript_15521/g.21916  ORF Transcript_15521/g.21916 Transcript_15521/m.21916 type:complete len:466 (+) Transcript_15521:178-1575(+)